jgi:hypothetical protein
LQRSSIIEDGYLLSNKLPSKRVVITDNYSFGYCIAMLTNCVCIPTCYSVVFFHIYVPTSKGKGVVCRNEVWSLKANGEDNLNSRTVVLALYYFKSMNQP